MNRWILTWTLPSLYHTEYVYNTRSRREQVWTAANDIAAFVFVYKNTLGIESCSGTYHTSKPDGHAITSRSKSLPQPPQAIQGYIPLQRW